MKKYFIIGLIIFCLFNINVYASTNTYDRTADNLLLPDWVDAKDLDINMVLNTYAVNANEKVYDFANYLTEVEEESLYSYAKKYIDYTGYDIVILTTDNLNEKNPYDYMYNFYDYNAFERNGLIFLVYKNGENNDIYIGTSKYGKDSKIEDIYDKVYIKEMNRYLRKVFKGNTNKGFEDFVSLAIGVYDIKTNSSRDYKVDENGKIIKKIYWLDYLVISFAITSIVVVVLIYINGINNKKIIEKDYLNKSTLIVNKVSEDIIDKPEK